MSTARGYLAAAVIDGKLYAVGGVGGTGTQNALEVYDPATNAWATLAPMPTARYLLAAAAIDGKLYAVGGTGSPGFMENVLEVYDPATDLWTARASMPTARYGLAAAAIGGRLYAVGGRYNSSNKNVLEIYDPATNGWAALAPMPAARHVLAAAAIDDKLYAVGGSGNTGVQNALEVYDPPTLVSSTITTTTWTAANGPYHVLGTITVPTGNTLTIEPGVDVLFDANAPFTVEGRIVVNGTESSPVSFAPGTSAAWAGLRIASGEASSLTHASITGSTGRGLTISGGGTHTLAHVTIANNTWTGEGGGVYVSASTVTMDECEIRANIASSGGGLFFANGSTITLNGCSVFGNSANFVTGYGGGIFVHGGSNVTVEGGRIVGNTAGYGGGIMLSGNQASLTMHRVVVEGNRADSNHGGALFAGSGDVVANIRQCTIAKNTAASAKGHAIYLEWNALVNVRDAIFWGNSVGAMIWSSDVPGEFGRLFLSYTTYDAPSEVLGNLSLANIHDTDHNTPLFIDLGHGDYHVGATSPMIDTGDPSSPLDEDGTRADKGAFPFLQMVEVSFTTVPAGLSISVDGTSYTMPQTFTWLKNSIHTYTVTSPQSAGTGVRYVVPFSGPFNITASGSMSIQWTFTKQYLLTTTAGTGGAVSPASAYNGAGSTVSVSAVPGTGYSFAGWSGDASGNQNPVAVPMDAPKTINAAFMLNSYALNVAIVGNGSVAKSPDQPTYTHGTEVRLTATAAAGWTFAGWSGDATGTANPLTITIDAAKNVTATFTQDEYALSVSVSGSGNVTKNPNQATYLSGSEVQLTAVADIGWSFDGWTGTGSGSYTGTDNPATVVMNGPMQQVAMFSQIMVPVTVTSSPPGRSFTVDGTEYAASQTFSWAYGSTHTVETTTLQDDGAGTRFLLSGWSDGATTTAAISLTVSPTSAATYTAIFTSHYRVWISMSTGADGPSIETYKLAGTIMEISATPSAGYQFHHWTGTGPGSYSGTDNPASISVNGPIEEAATFTMSISVSTSPAGLAFSVDGTDYTAEQALTWFPWLEHTIATISAQSGTPGTRYLFDSWSDGGAVSHTVAPWSPTTYTASFNTEFELTTSAGEGGSVSPAGGWHAAGSSVELMATPDVGWEFAGWTGDVTGMDNPVTVTMNSPVMATATFARIEYTLSVTIVGGGSVAKVPDQATYHYGDVVQLTATPSSGWTFAGWSGDATDANASISLTIDDHTSLTASFGFVRRINAGGGEVATGGHTWVADGYYSGATRVEENMVLTDIAGTTDDELYRTAREAQSNKGAFAYAIPLGTGTYTVRLHFVELSLGLQGVGHGNPNAPGLYQRGDVVGKRVFSVSAEGASLLADYDIAADVGIGTAVIKEFTGVAVSGGELDLAFSASEGRPTIAAIEILAGAPLARVPRLQPVSVVNYSVIDAKDGAELGLIADGGTLDLAALPTGNLFVRANIAFGPADGVHFSINGVSADSAGDLAAGDRFSWRIPFAGFTGRQTIVATPLLGDNEGGIGHTISFSVVDVAKFSLAQNAPNPFNPSTTIRFGIERQGQVRLAIYNATGQLVRALVDGELAPGRHEVAWDGTDVAGRQVASGVYVYRLVAKEGVKVRRMTLLR